VGIELIDLVFLLEKELNHKVDVVSRNGIKAKYFKEIEKDIVYVCSVIKTDKNLLE
jgi:predicted nucleotidyltransferase